MANRSTEIGRLVRTDPEAARDRVRRALLATRGNRIAAGRLLDVSQNQIVRIVARLGLVGELARIRDRFGYIDGRTPEQVARARDLYVIRRADVAAMRAIPRMVRERR